MSVCYNCFKEYDEDFGLCPYCGTAFEELPHDAYLLKCGTVLEGRYIIGKAVGSGGFGNVYKAWDKKLETIVAVKEYYPKQIVNRIEGTAEVVLVSGRFRNEFNYGRQRLLQEARNIAKFSSHKNIVNVFEYFEANNTSYMVMEYLHGEPLNVKLKESGGKLDKDKAIYTLSSICDALISLHKAGIIHRDISPDNIYVCDNGVVTLFDFGTAEFPDGKNKLPVIVKQGFAPPEQYESENRQGAWTDIYALGATLYQCLTGKKPMPSNDRKVCDELKAPNELEPTLSEQLSNTVMKAMAVDMHLRFQNVADFKKATMGEMKVLPVEKERKKRKRKRRLGLIAAVLVLCIGIASVFGALEYQKKNEVLDPAEISVLVCGDESGWQYTSVTEIVKLFNEAYPQIEVNVSAVDSVTYPEKIAELNSESELPTVFFSSGLDSENLGNATDISSVLKTVTAENTYFLKNYGDAYSDKKKLPLGIDIPLAYLIVNGENAVSYDKTDFSKLYDFGTYNISVNKNAANMLEKSLNESFRGKSEDKFFSGNTPVLFSSAKDYFDVQKNLGGRYKVVGISAENKICCSFDNEWSIGNGSKAEIRAAKKLLEFMLSSAAQDVIYFDVTEKSGILPLNTVTFDAYTNEIFPELQVVGKAYENYSLEVK